MGVVLGQGAAGHELPERDRRDVEAGVALPGRRVVHPAMFVLVGVMYVIMAGTVWLGPETQGLSLEEASEGRTGDTDFGGR